MNRLIAAGGFRLPFSTGTALPALATTISTDRFRTLAAVVAVLAVFGLRAAGIDAMHMREDEEIAFRTTARDLAFTVYYQAEQDVHAPVWFVSFWLWQQVAGSTEFTARAYSLLWSTLTLALVYRLGRRWFGGAHYGLLAVIVLGANVYAFIYSLEIRPYALVMFVATLNMLLFSRWLERGTRRSALVYGASVALLLWIHYFLAFLVMAQALYVVLFRLNRRVLTQGLLAAGLALALWSPWLPVFARQVMTLKQLETETGVFRGLGIGNTTEPTTLDAIRNLIALATNGQPLLYGILLALGAFYLRRRQGYRLALAWAVAVPAINLTVNLVASVYTPRYLSYIAPGLALAAGAGLGALPRPIGALALAGFVALNLWSLPAFIPNHIPYRHIFRTMSAEAKPGDAIFLTAANENDRLVRWQIEHYIDDGLLDNRVDSVAEASQQRGVWLVTGDFFNPTVQDSFRRLEATHPLQRVVGRCDAQWCYLAQRLEGPPPVEARVFGDTLVFRGVDIDRVSAERIETRLWWSADERIPVDYSIGLHLIAPDGSLAAQSDGPIQVSETARLETSALEPGRVVMDRRALVAENPLPPGEYHLELVVYQWWDQARLTLPDGSDTLRLATVQIAPPGS